MMISKSLLHGLDHLIFVTLNKFRQCDTKIYQQIDLLLINQFMIKIFLGDNKFIKHTNMKQRKARKQLVSFKKNIMILLVGLQIISLEGGEQYLKMQQWNLIILLFINKKAKDSLIIILLIQIMKT